MLVGPVSARTFLSLSAMLVLLCSASASASRRAASCGELAFSSNRQGSIDIYLIRSDGTLGGYAGGLDRKQHLLEAEGAVAQRHMAL